MRKQWLGICIAAGMLAACTSDDGQQQTVSVPQPAVCNGPIVEISGADPRFEVVTAGPAGGLLWARRAVLPHATQWASNSAVSAF